MLPCRKTLVACLCFCSVLLAAGEAGVWLDVPFVKQEKNGCGAASVAMIIMYWQGQQGQRGNVDAGRIQQALYSRKAHGIYASDLKRYLDQHGFRTFVFRGQWSDLEEQLEKGRPLMVALRPPAQTQLHYVVVAGLDSAGPLTNDPAERKLLKRERSQFEKEWQAAANWTLLAVPNQDTGSATY